MKSILDNSVEKSLENESSVLSVQEGKKENDNNIPPTKIRNETPYTAFTKNRRFAIIAIVTTAGFLGPVSGNIYIPLLPTFQDVFKTNTIVINSTVSLFMLVFAFAPLIWAPWADFGGRKFLYLVSLTIFVIANVLLATVPANLVALFILRIVQAFGASSLMSLGAGTIADITPPKERAKILSYYMVGPQLGPVIGPILSVIASNNQWRWIFGFLAILGGLVCLTILFFLPETLRYFVGNGEVLKLKGFLLKPQWRKQEKLVEGFPKPPRPSFTGYWNTVKFPPVILSSISTALLFATFYGVSVTFTNVLKEKYGFNSIQRSLSYICPGLSLISGSLIAGRISDYTRRKIEVKFPHSYIPEKRFSIQIFGLIISMGGVLMYGWCVDKNSPVITLFVATFCTGFGMTWVFVTTTTYLTECSKTQPATNVAIANCFRNISAAVCAVIIDPLTSEIGFGWCFTGLALLDVISIVIVVLLIFKGPEWRKIADIKASNIIK